MIILHVHYENKSTLVSHYKSDMLIAVQPVFSCCLCTAFASFSLQRHGLTEAFTDRFTITLVNGQDSFSAFLF